MGNASQCKFPRRRDDVPFTWTVSCGMPVYASLAGVRFDRAFREVDAIVEAYTVGRPRAAALFGPEVQYAGPSWNGISYGHVNCLGAPLVFPEDSEVAHRPIYASLEEGIAALERPVDWATAGLMPHYLELWHGLQAAFPEQVLAFPGYGVEGPITTAWELRGHGFFEDVYAESEQCKTYLGLVTESIIAYRQFIRDVNGEPAFDGKTIGLADDVSAMLAPRMWPELVLPYHDRFFAAQTCGWRTAHIEDLTPAHLPFLDALKLSSFDVSVSPRLSPGDLRERCQVPFVWRLNEMQARDMTREAIHAYVVTAVAEGASGFTCALYRGMTGPEMVAKIGAFMADCRAIARLLAEGCSRERLATELA